MASRRISEVLNALVRGGFLSTTHQASRYAAGPNGIKVLQNLRKAIAGEERTAARLDPEVVERAKEALEGRGSMLAGFRVVGQEGKERDEFQFEVRQDGEKAELVLPSAPANERQHQEWLFFMRGGADWRSAFIELTIR